MSRQFHTMRKDGTSLMSHGSLGSAMDEMGAGMVMFMGSNTDALRITAALSRWSPRNVEPGTLLQIGMEGGSRNDNDR